MQRKSFLVFQKSCNFYLNLAYVGEDPADLLQFVSFGSSNANTNGFGLTQIVNSLSYSQLGF